jgi:LPXTG-motif cell wall-anchored protein
MKDNKMSKNSHAKHEHKKKHENQSYQTPHEDYQAGAFGDVIIGLLIMGLGLFFILPFFALLNDSALLLVLGIYFVVIVGFVVYISRKRKRK